MCNARKSIQYKIIKVGGDRYHQKLESCLGCKLQTEVKLTELKKGNAYVRNQRA
jgi:hypothetical protein